jgi:TonB family protein
MATYTTFASHILFKKILNDSLGSFYRAGEFDSGGVTRKVWLRVFDGAAVPKSDVIGSIELADGIADTLKAANVAEDVAHPVDDGVPGLAQKWVGGRPLSTVFEKVENEGFPVPVDNALLILEKLALAVSAGLAVDVGGNTLVHGFLHPGLILVTNDGEAIVSGFGISEQLLGVLDTPEAAQEAAPYLAPEVIMTRTTGKRGDIYSLGAILYHLLTGQALPADPAARDGVLDRAELSYDGEPIPDDIKGLIRRAIANRPEERFSSAADFKKELDKLLYGGAYSPTTFNLALFMDRLFRSEIEEDEKEMAAEDGVDVEPYLRPEPEPEVEMDAPSASTAATRPANRGLIYGALGLVAVVAVVIGVLLGRSGGPDAPVQPTPTAEEIAAQKQAQEDRIKELAAQIAEEKLREKEEEITQELQASQERIDALQRQLQQAQKESTTDADAERRQAEIQAQIEAEQEAQKQQQAELEAERQRAEEEARLQAEREAEAQRQAEEERRLAEAAAAETTEPRAQASDATEVAEAQPTEQSAPKVTVTENQFVRPEEADTLPAILREEAVTWPRSALHSRRKGIVVVQATVNARGLVDDVKILRADEEGFGIPQAVMDAVRNYRFKPGTKDGVNIKTTATVTKPYSFRGR